MSYEGLPERLARVRDVIGRAQQRGGWSHPVTVIGVTKGHSADAVSAAVAARLTDVGENRVQEALGKQATLGPLSVRWHLIGSLQRNKAKLAAGRFALIHSIDREDLALELAKRVAPGTRQPVLIEVNCSGEAQKGGVDPAAAADLVGAVVATGSLEFRGLMTMAALTDDEQLQRGAFGRLRKLKERLESEGTPVAELSMGMSGDYPIAVEEGATMVRLGTILFGERVSHGG